MARMHELRKPTAQSVAANMYELTPDEASQLYAMDSADQPIADYSGFPEVQAQILLDRRVANPLNNIEGTDTGEYTGYSGLGIYDREMTAGRESLAAPKLGTTVVKLADIRVAVDRTEVA
jgi:hypothetical protein